MAEPKLVKRHVFEDQTIDIDDKADFGEDVSLDISGSIEIGYGTYLAHGAKVFTHYHKDLKGPIGGHKVGEAIPTKLVIGKHVFVGEDVMILPQCTHIDDWAVIGARSVLTKNVGRGEIWAGNPAKHIGNREE